MTVETVRDRHTLALDVDLVHIAAKKVYMTKHLTNGVNDVRQVQIARGDLVQHWGEQKKILPVYNSHFEPRIATLLELQRGIKTAKSPAENEDAGFLIGHMIQSTLRSRRSNSPNDQA